MSGQRLLGVPMIITPSMSERNRLAAAAAQAKEAQKGGGQSRVFVAGLHPSLGMEEIRQVRLSLSFSCSHTLVSPSSSLSPLVRSTMCSSTLTSRRASQRVSVRFPAYFLLFSSYFML